MKYKLSVSEIFCFATYNIQHSCIREIFRFKTLMKYILSVSEDSPKLSGQRCLVKNTHKSEHEAHHILGLTNLVPFFPAYAFIIILVTPPIVYRNSIQLLGSLKMLML